MNPLRFAARLVWDPLMGMPMSWRAAMILFATIVLTYSLVRLFGRRILRATTALACTTGEAAGAVVLLPEFFVTRRLRAAGYAPLPGTYALGAGLQTAARALEALNQFVVARTAPERPMRKPQWRLVFTAGAVLAVLPVAAWETRIHLSGGSALGAYIDKGIYQWCALESWVLDDAAMREACERAFGGSNTGRARPRG